MYSGWYRLTSYWLHGFAVWSRWHDIPRVSQLRFKETERPSSTLQTVPKLMFSPSSPLPQRSQIMDFNCGMIFSGKWGNLYSYLLWWGECRVSGSVTRIGTSLRTCEAVNQHYVPFYYILQKVRGDLKIICPTARNYLILWRNEMRKKKRIILSTIIRLLILFFLVENNIKRFQRRNTNCSYSEVVTFNNSARKTLNH